MDGDQPTFRNDYNNPNGAPPMEFHERGLPGGRDSYPPPGHHGGDRYEPDFRGRRDSRDYGYDHGRQPPPYHGGNNGRWGGNRSRSRSPRNRPQRGNDDHNSTNNTTRKALHAMEPMDSYKVFMMRQDENSTPETYQQRYEEYKKKYLQRLSRAFFEDHKREEWLQERYSPAIRFRLEQLKNAKKIGEAKQFMERVASGITTIDMDEENTLKGQDYDNDLEDSKRILYVRRIPCACPIATLSEAIKKAGGVFQQIYLSDPVKKSNFEFDRTAYIVFETAEMAAETLPKIHNTFVQDGETFPPFRLQVSQHRSRAPLKTPSYLSVPERLTHDYAQALKLAIALDDALYSKPSDRSSCGIEALLAHEDVATKYTSDKQKLDLVMAYLRRIHHFIYYAGVQCLDMGDIMHAHPALFCRPPPTQKDLEQGEKGRSDSVEDTEAKSTGIGGWAASLDEKVQSFLQEWNVEKRQAAQEKEKILVEEIEAREELSLESTYSNYAEKAGDDGKHRCRLCTKLFKAVDFVKKHIRNKHPELVVDKVAEVGESYMWEQYREDPNRPLPPIETTNTLSNPTLGGRPGGRGSYNDRGPGDRGGPRNSGYGSRDSPNGYRDRGYNNGPRSGPRGPFNDRPTRSPPRRPPQGDMPVDPRSISKSYQDLDNLKDNKVELSFDDAFDSLPPPKKKTKV